MLGEEHLPEPLSDLVSGLQFFGQVLGFLTRVRIRLPDQPGKTISYGEVE